MRTPAINSIAAQAARHLQYSTSKNNRINRIITRVICLFWCPYLNYRECGVLHTVTPFVMPFLDISIPSVWVGGMWSVLESHQCQQPKLTDLRKMRSLWVSFKDYCNPYSILVSLSLSLPYALTSKQSKETHTHTHTHSHTQTNRTAHKISRKKKKRNSRAESKPYKSFTQRQR